MTPSTLRSSVSPVAAPGVVPEARGHQRVAARALGSAWAVFAALALLMIPGLDRFAIDARLYGLLVPLGALALALAVGLFEVIFFRGFVQARLEASFGLVPGVLLAAALYAAYHVGYGMNLGEMAFLLGLGVTYAVAFRITGNLLAIWPLLVPLGSFFNRLQAADMAALPWAAILGFADVIGIIAAVIWFAYKRERRAAMGTTRAVTATPSA